jgi:Mg-chelatase subunit ChlD
MSTQDQEGLMTSFTADVYQNEYLPMGGSEVNAIVTVTASGAAGSTGQPAAAEIVIVDTSGSMDVPKVKITSVMALPSR